MCALAGNCLSYSETGSVELSIGAASYGRYGIGAKISYAIAPSELGGILLAATQSGICWLGIHESESHLESELRGDFPKALIGHKQTEMHELTQRVVRFVSKAESSLEIALDIRATPFQLAVWRELCAIPAGTTRSYGEIARRLGRPNAARAVGHANGSNPLAILIPCHRAIGSDGSLTGYRWGIEYKSRLLECERTGERPQ